MPVAPHDRHHTRRASIELFPGSRHEADTSKPIETTEQLRIATDLWAFAAHWTGLGVDEAEGDQIEF
jgi:hypothetical protein